MSGPEMSVEEWGGAGENRVTRTGGISKHNLKLSLRALGSHGELWRGRGRVRCALWSAFLSTVWTPGGGQGGRCRSQCLCEPGRRR